MEKRLLRWEAGAALFTLLFGTLVHFFYEWSGEAAAVGAFSAVNESVWEHGKLIFVPMFLEFFVHARFLGGTWPNLPAARLAAVVTALTVMISGYYTYTGIFGRHALWADILLFAGAVLLGFMVEFRVLRRGSLSGLIPQIISLLLLWMLAFVFVWCTFHPPELPLWRDPTNGQYGR